MGDTDPRPAVQRRRLRAELRRAREDAGLTQGQVAKAMEWSLSKVIRIEKGEVGVSANDLKALLHYYKITDGQRTAELLGYARASRERSWWTTHDHVSKVLGELIEYENAADLSRHYESFVVPGLLQTVDYIRASTRQLAPQWPDDMMEVIIETRLKRQELLGRPDAPALLFVVDEAVIRRNVGGKEVMARQLQHLIEAAAMPKVTFEVVPFSAGLVPGMQAPFVIHEFPDEADHVLYREDPRGDLLKWSDRDEISSYRENFDRLRRASLGPEGTVDFLRTVIGE